MSLENRLQLSIFALCSRKLLSSSFILSSPLCVREGWVPLQSQHRIAPAATKSVQGRRLAACKHTSSAHHNTTAIFWLPHRRISPVREVNKNVASMMPPKGLLLG